MGITVWCFLTRVHTPVRVYSHVHVLSCTRIILCIDLFLNLRLRAWITMGAYYHVCALSCMHAYVSYYDLYVHLRYLCLI